jgi:hypothetical protein
MELRRERPMRRTRRNRETGIALILALLSLMLLTFLGLTLATTTSTELQIANNYRWSQQAYYNAEAGIEAGRRALSNVDWSTVLYPPRAGGATGWDGVTDPTLDAEGSKTPASREYENWTCDARGNGAGYGRLLSVGGTTYIDQTIALGQAIDGAFTLWVRRPVVARKDGTFEDYSGNDRVILTAEGIAPYSDATTDTNGNKIALVSQNRASRTIEVQFGSSATSVVCGTLGGQVGGGPSGGGFGGCVPIDKKSMAKNLGFTNPPTENETAK